MEQIYPTESFKKDKDIFSNSFKNSKDLRWSQLCILVLCMFIFSAQGLTAQCTGSFTIFTEDFEDNGNTVNGGSARYSSPFDFYDPASDDDYWGRVQGSTEEYFLTNLTSGEIANSNVTYSGWNGDFFYAGEDLDDSDSGSAIGNPDEQDIKEILFTNINITDATNMCFSGLFASGENDPCTMSTYDDADYINIYYNIDGTGEVLAMCFNPDIGCNPDFPTDITNEPLHHDPDCNGDGGEGTLLSAAFQEFTFNIPSTGNSLDLRIEVHMDSGSEEIAIDYLRIRSDSAVPIELLGFKGKQERDVVSLQWSTAAEINNDYFVIEHSLDGKIFQEIDMVDGAGNSSKQRDYSINHKDAVNGLNYYRLKQVDFDGEYSYSNILKVDFKSEENDLNISPNPFTDEITLHFSSSFEKNVLVEIYDIAGRLVNTNSLGKSQFQKTLSLGELESGIYFIQIRDGENRIIKKITKL